MVEKNWQEHNEVKKEQIVESFFGKKKKKIIGACLFFSFFSVEKHCKEIER
jgi:hypothetical protein